MMMKNGMRIITIKYMVWCPLLFYIHTQYSSCMHNNSDVFYPILSNQARCDTNSVKKCSISAADDDSYFLRQRLDTLHKQQRNGSWQKKKANSLIESGQDPSKHPPDAA